MRIVKQAVYVSIFGTSVCLESCVKGSNQDKLSLDANDSINIHQKDGTDTETDSVSSGDTTILKMAN